MVAPQPDKGAAEETIVAVFGNRPGEPKKEGQRSGAVVFYDAWPVAWPKLTADILNNHHTDYYRGEDAGDWENPEPVYFLAVPPDTTFEFAMAKRRMETPDALLKQAREWLLGDCATSARELRRTQGMVRSRPRRLPLPCYYLRSTQSSRPHCDSSRPPSWPAKQQAEDCDLRGHAARSAAMVVADHARRLLGCRYASAGGIRHLG